MRRIIFLLLVYSIILNAQTNYLDLHKDAIVVDTHQSKYTGRQVSISVMLPTGENDAAIGQNIGRKIAVKIKRQAVCGLATWIGAI